MLCGSLLVPAMCASSFVSAAFTVTLTSLAAAEGDTEKKPSDVIDITQEMFESTVNPEPLILVEFFAPWYVILHVHVNHGLTCPGVDTARLSCQNMRWP